MFQDAAKAIESLAMSVAYLARPKCGIPNTKKTFLCRISHEKLCVGGSKTE